MSQASLRFDGQDHTFWSFIDHVDVCCPNCDGHARLTLHRENDHSWAGSYSFRCIHCAANREFTAVFEIDSMRTKDPTIWQGMKLWLQTRCRGQIFWAMNRTHLRYLKDYISSEQRGREKKVPHENSKRVLKRSWRGFHLTSRLPRWMVLKSSRPHVLRAIHRLESKLKTPLT